LIEKFVLKQSNNQYKTAVLIAEQLSILLFCQDDQVGNAGYYDHFTTRGVCYYSLDLLEDKATQLKMGNHNTLSDHDKKKVIDSVEQEYLACLFLNNSNVKLHSQLKKDVANDYSKWNTDAYPTNIHKALTLMNKYKPLKMDTPTIPTQGTAFVTGAKGNKKKVVPRLPQGSTSEEEKVKVIEARKKSKANDDDDKSTSSSKYIKSLSKMLKTLDKSNCKLKKSVSALQKCNEDDNESSMSSEGTKPITNPDMDCIKLYC
jgi:hypothetical protein